MNEIRVYVQQQRALGTSRFHEAIEAELQCVATAKSHGWPPTKPGDFKVHAQHDQ